MPAALEIVEAFAEHYWREAAKEEDSEGMDGNELKWREAIAAWVACKGIAQALAACNG